MRNHRLLSDWLRGDLATKTRPCCLPLGVLVGTGGTGYKRAMIKAIGLGRHPVSGESTFAQEIVNGVYEEFPRTGVASIVRDSSPEREFERNRDLVVSGIYSSVLESTKGLVAMASTPSEASYMVEQIERLVTGGVSGAMDLSNLDTVAVGCCRKLAEKIHNNRGGSVTEYSTDKFKSAIGGLDELILNPLTNRMYPDLASEVVKVKSESETILMRQGGGIERQIEKILKRREIESEPKPLPVQCPGVDGGTERSGRDGREK